MDQMDVVLLGQAHSHPTGAGVTHSHGDDLWTFSPFEGAMSVIVPDYAADGRRHDQWGVHRFLGGEYRVIPQGAHGDHLTVVPDVVDRR